MSTHAEIVAVSENAIRAAMRLVQTEHPNIPTDQIAPGILAAFESLNLTGRLISPETLVAFFLKQR